MDHHNRERDWILLVVGIGIMLLGNYEELSPTAAQLATLDQAIALLRARYGIKRHRVYGHRDLAPSVCPGRHLYPHLTAIRA